MISVNIEPGFHFSPKAAWTSARPAVACRFRAVNRGPSEVEACCLSKKAWAASLLDTGSVFTVTKVNARRRYMRHVVSSAWNESPQAVHLADQNTTASTLPVLLDLICF